MNSRRKKQLRYVFGDASEVLSGETISSWITGSSNGQVILDQEKVAAFVANLAAAYDTAGKMRTFTGVSGACLLYTSSQYFRDCVEEVGLDMEARGIELGYFNYVD